MIGRQIHEFNIRAMATSKAKIKKAFIGLSTDIIMDTPVLSGRLKNNWMVSKNIPSNETTESTSNQSINRVNAVTFELGDTLYLTNNLPYAERIEFGLYPSPSKTGKTVNGFSVKSPSGMVRKNIIRWSRYFA